MNDEITQLVIRNEDDAWQALEQALHGDGFPDALQLRFDGWPSFELVVQGRDWHSTVPTRIMPALIEVQKDISRAYAHIRYSEPNLRRLKDDERDSIEVVVKVKNGSSAYDADLWQQLTQLARAAIERMNGTEAVIAVLGVALTIMAPVMFKAWLNARTKEQRMAHDLALAETDAANRVALSEQETKRLQIMRQAAAVEPIVETAREDAQATTNRLLKATRPGDTIGIGGVTVTSAEAQELVRPERERAKEVELRGQFAVLGCQNDKVAGFRIRVRSVADGAEFHAEVPLELPIDQQQAIRDAEWSKGSATRTVMLHLDAARLHDTIRNAIVTKATTVELPGAESAKGEKAR